MKWLVILLAISLALGSTDLNAAQERVPETAIPDGMAMFRDTERGVTCWYQATYYRYGMVVAGLSCLPDWMLKGGVH